MKIGIISDIHEDILSLSRALRMLEKERCDRVVSLGDIVGFDNGYYGAGRVQDAEACIRLVEKGFRRDLRIHRTSGCGVPGRYRNVGRSVANFPVFSGRGERVVSGWIRLRLPCRAMYSNYFWPQDSCSIILML